jgi:hypothetical protein
MTKVTRTPFNKLTLIVGGLVAVLAIGGFSVYDWQTHSKKLIAESAKWQLTGAPCTSVTADQFRTTANPLSPNPYAANLKFGFEDYDIARASGDVYCSEVMLKPTPLLTTIPACQFAHPVKLSITGPSGTFYFTSGNSPVTLFIEDGKPRCLLAGWYQRGVKVDGTIQVTGH